jgi:CO/xanthine dehydrogenase Mo-binding subunit
MYLVHSALSCFEDFAHVFSRCASDHHIEGRWQWDCLLLMLAHQAVLELAADKAGCHTPLPEGHGHGIAVHESFGSFVAQVAEVSVSGEGQVTVHRVVCAIDRGGVVNPDTIHAQMESGIVFGLTAALYGKITFEKRTSPAE